MSGFNATPVPNFCPSPEEFSRERQAKVKDLQAGLLRSTRLIYATGDLVTD